jgi:hypothetical protein
MSEDAQPVSYEGVPVGVPLLTNAGEPFGTLVKVLEVPSEDLFDGVIVKTDAGQRFVDRDQISEITTQYIKCDLDEAAAAALPEPSGTAVLTADAEFGDGRTFTDWVHRTFGHKGWKQQK